MKPTTTRTLNPLPFRDLEPHRFEDLVRALAYGFRNWKSLEAIGRSGGDEGMDIRGTEIVTESSVVILENTDPDEDTPISQERTWIFQCKRERTISPGRIPKIIEESLRSYETPPYAFVLACSCDLSKKARDAFRAEMVKRGIQEFYVWSRGEMEDMLYQAENDRILFAFFNLSLQPRKRSVATQLRHDLAIKKRLSQFFNDRGESSTVVLLRDPEDDRYPNGRPDGSKNSHWFLCELQHNNSPEGILVMKKKYLAWIALDGKHWDALLDHDSALSWNAQRVHDASFNKKSIPEVEKKYQNYWEEYAPSERRAHLIAAGLVPYSRIIAIDPEGDGYFPIPQIYVEWDTVHGPFESDGEAAWFEGVYDDRSGSKNHISLRPKGSTRIKLFPENIPESLFPPQKEIDVLSTKPSISKESKENLVGILKPLAEKQKELSPPPGSGKDGSENITKFHDWADTTAQPVLTGIVKELRTQGHEARIAREKQRTGEEDETEFVEIRFRIIRGKETAYRSTGYLRFTSSRYRALEIHQYPSENDRGSRDFSVSSLEALTAEEIEKKVITTVKTMVERGY